jgi:tripartite-type tricarboxylate transporter receptor subunit TctC
LRFAAWPFAACAALAAAILASEPAHTQGYPDRPIKIVVPAGPGGPTDVLARLVADQLQATLGQSAVVENRGGGGGVIGARAVVSADADGYTLLFGNTATLANIPAVSRSAGYDPSKAFAAVAKIMDSYQVLVVSPNLPVKSVQELIAYAKANPGKLNFGAAGVGNITHLSGELLKARTGTDFQIVQYKSGAESLNAILGGQVHFTIDNVTAVRALVKDGRLRALAVTSPARKPELPDVPTMIEAGLPGFVVTSFFGVVAPAGTPKPAIDKLNAVINEGLKSEAFRTSLSRLGAQATPETPEQFEALIAGETRKWSDIAATANIRVD